MSKRNGQWMSASAATCLSASLDKAWTPNYVREWGVALLISIALTLVGGWIFGVQLALALSTITLIHEIGHWLVWRLAGQSSVILFNPFFGFTIPLNIESMPLPFVEGVLFLGGTGLSLLVAIGLFAWDAASGYPCVHNHPFVYRLILLVPLVNMLNMVLVLPVVDGGRLLMLLVPGSWKARPVVLSTCWAVAGIITCEVSPPYVTIITLLASLWLLISLFLDEYEKNCRVVKSGTMISLRPLPSSGIMPGDDTALSRSDRVILAGLWMIITIVSICLVSFHPISRDVILSWLSHVGK